MNEASQTTQSSTTIRQWFNTLSVSQQRLLWLPLNLLDFFFYSLGWVVAALAAIAKALGAAYGTLILLAFCYTGTLAILANFLTVTHLFLGTIIAIFGILLSLAMEGRKTIKNVHNLYDKLPARINALRDYIKKHFSKPNWSKFLLNLSIEMFSLAYLLVMGTGITKGASMAAGALGMSLAFLHIMAIPLTTSLLTIIASYSVIAGICVGCISFIGKEGPQFNKHINYLKAYLRGDDDHHNKLINIPRKTYDKTSLAIAWSVPVLAAIAKACGYTFGALTLLAYFILGYHVYGHTALIFSATVLTPLNIVLAVTLATSVFCVSLGMEGLYTADKIYYWLTGEHLKTNKQIDSKTDVNKKLIKNNERTATAWPGFKQANWNNYSLAMIRSVMDVLTAVSIIAPLSKGTSMMAGSIGILLAISLGLHLQFSLPFIISTAMILGIAASGVSIGKEWSDDLVQRFGRFKQWLCKQYLDNNVSITKADVSVDEQTVNSVKPKSTHSFNSSSYNNPLSKSGVGTTKLPLHENQLSVSKGYIAPHSEPSEYRANLKKA